VPNAWRWLESGQALCAGDASGSPVDVPTGLGEWDRAVMDPVTYYRRATGEDVETLITLRLAFLAELSGAKPADLDLRSAISQYFSRSLAGGNFTAFLAQADSRIVSVGGLIYDQHAPSNRNPTGREGYIMNMYTLPEFRRRGIGSRILEMLVDEARQNQCGKIALHAVPGAKAIYEKFGFKSVETEMRLSI
jgi:GNAT superfamily N-acetyltransferase